MEEYINRKVAKIREKFGLPVGVRPTDPLYREAEDWMVYDLRRLPPRFVQLAEYMEKLPRFFPAESATQLEVRHRSLRDLQRQLQQHPVLYRTYRVTRYTYDNHLAEWDLATLASINSPPGINIDALVHADAFLAPIRPMQHGSHRQLPQLQRAARAHRNRRASTHP